MKRYIYIILVLFICIFNFSCKKYDEDGYQIEKNLDYISNQNDSANVKNIILIIGDGMGLNQVELTKKFGPRKELDLEKAEYKGMINTNCLDNYVTDSAAAATAIATGVRTLYERIGMDQDGNNLKTILDYAYEAGMMTGLLTTDNLTGATPGGFSAHVLNRYNDKEKIVRDQINSTIDVLMGYGEIEFYEKKDEIEKKGWDYIEDRKSMEKSKSNKIISVFSKLTNEENLPTLAEMTEKAIDVLSKDKDGFVLVIEEAQIDKKIDRGLIDEMMDAVISLDKALRVALNFMRKNDDTIVIVLADHETGGLVLKEGNPDLSWFTEETRYHTNVDVPIYAFGTRSSIFDNCMINNNEVFDKMMELLHLDK